MKRHRKTKYQGNDAYHFIDILLVGDGGAGKTSIIDRLTRDTFNAVISSSIREDKARISYSIELTDFQLMTNNKSVQLRIIDSEKFDLASNREQVSQQYRTSSVILFCCDLSRRDAFDRRHHWLSNIRRDAPASCVIGIIGTQSDKSSTCVTESDLKSFCEDENLAFWIACSARENKNIRELFVVAVEKAQQRYQQAKELSDGINAKTSSEGEGEQSAHQLSVADCMMGQVPARECPGIMSHSSASVTSSPMASMPNLQLLFFNHTKMNGLTENLNKVTQTPVTPPSLPLLYESYKMHGGSWRAALSIFGIFDYRSRDEIYATLKERSVSGGASFKTLQQFNLT